MDAATLEATIDAAWEDRDAITTTTSGERRDAIDFTPDSSRRARAIEVWAALKSLGRAGLAELVARNCRQARALANRVNREAETDEQRIQLLFELLYCRSPDASERQFILEFLLAENQETSSELTAWERLSLAMLGSNEFCFLD